MPNRLIGETSPYLLQHAENPVEWYPWGEEAFSRAREENKPVLLSIGYSACHWCHVMAHESFEDEAIAAIMNEYFVNIKVDREERPDVDHVYMTAVQAMTGRGGWPLTVFLTPDGKPFYGGTYFPVRDGFGMPGFARVLTAISDAYHTRPEDVEKTVAGLGEVLSLVQKREGGGGPLSVDILTRAYRNIALNFDSDNGGFGAMPKFPQPHLLEFILRYSLRNDETEALAMVEKTLQKMACGGIYDQLGGGFHRYSTDARWLVPHFEKMLYDNALLGALYVHAFQITGNDFYRFVAEETMDYVLRDMTGDAGEFYSSEDADSEGVEGKYYIWTEEEIDQALDRELSHALKQHYHITCEGNFEGSNILYRYGIQAGDKIVQKAKQALLAKREQRTRPGRDDKVISGWNGLMITALAEAACVLDHSIYLDAAVECGNFIHASMMKEGLLLHSWKDGVSHVKGYLQDYAFVIAAYLALHKATLDSVWLTRALHLGESMVAQFWDESEGALYDAGTGHEALFIRSRQVSDDAMPGGLSSAAMVLLQLSSLTGKEKYRMIAEKSLGEAASGAAETPMGFAYWLCALDFYFAETIEIGVAGSPQDRRTQELGRALCRYWLPNAVTAAFDPAAEEGTDQVELLAHKTLVEGKPALYLCRGHTCMEPVTRPEDVRAMLRRSGD